ncbi:hypothetical protein NLG97_g10062 [Lecanicillium saksenae]|uniref:Uncharacterized protein n=1 Tax=Lecanicillium saksenae TaxID=468837 RepID=A0ACC1QFY6_9HYPO|nr:hypothetical protein NLG97_g10062 [Lecanicillium saksenae]
MPRAGRPSNPPHDPVLPTLDGNIDDNAEVLQELQTGVKSVHRARGLIQKFEKIHKKRLSSLQQEQENLCLTYQELSEHHLRGHKKAKLESERIENSQKETEYQEMSEHHLREHKKAKLKSERFEKSQKETEAKIRDLDNVKRQEVSELMAMENWMNRRILLHHINRTPGLNEGQSNTKYPRATINICEADFQESLADSDHYFSDNDYQL